MNTQEYPQELVESVTEMARLVTSEEDVESTVQRIAKLAVHAIGGADVCSISFARKGNVETLASTSDTGSQIDQIQKETGEGPCHSSAEEWQTFHLPEMKIDKRWPAFSKRAAEETGIQSMVCYVMKVHEDGTGAMNMMSQTVDAFDEAAIQAGTIFAAQAAVGLSNAMTHAKDLSQVANLEEALDTNRIIGQAVGMIMATRRCDSDAAFATLVKISQTTNTKLRALAQQLVDKAADL